MTKNPGTTGVKDIRTKNYVDPSLNKPRDLSEADVDSQFQMEADGASQDHSVKGDVEVSDNELLRRFRAAMLNSVLPDAPEIPGYKLCWVPEHSNNQFDTVDFRKGLGYELVKASEVPKFRSPSNRSGQYEGCVSHQELILMKLPLRLWTMYMKDNHHTSPNEQERAIKQKISQMTDNEGKNIVRDMPEMSGINRLARKVAEPVFN